MSERRERLHPGGGAIARLLDEALASDEADFGAAKRPFGPATLLLRELRVDRFAVALAARAELDPGAAFVALDLVRLEATPGDPRALIALLLLLLQDLELGSTRLAIGTDAARTRIEARLSALEVQPPLTAEVVALCARIAGRPPERARTPAPKRTSQLELGGLAEDTPTRLAVPLLIPRTPTERSVLDVVHRAGEVELALGRWCDAERALREALSARRAVMAPETVMATLAHVPPIEEGTRRIRLTDEQQRAVTASLLGPTTVITGGPGTGKTSIVVAILRAFLRLSPEAAVHDIALAAPTGKAADRMQQAIGAALGGATDPRDRALASGVAPMTLHRLLGYQPDLDRYRHHAASRLPQRLVVLDEASMLDTMLFGRLVEALGDDALLVLLGDPDQLPSVGAGAVLRDLGVLAPLSNGALRVATLSHSHRMSEGDPAGAHVLSVARQVGAGISPPRAQTSTPVAGTWTEVDVSAPFPDGASLLPSTKHLGRWLDRWLDSLALDARIATTAFGALDAASALGDTNEVVIARAIEAAHASRLLVVTRGSGQRTGQQAVNAYLGARHAERMKRRGTSEPAAGEPVVVTRNDYLRGIYNGDTGLVVQVNDGSLAVALTQRGRVRLLPMLDVHDAIERAWALTVHRAQGSEHERVALLLPERDVPRLLTRQIVYTAITRARRAVQVVGDPAMLAAAIARKQDRRTGLTD